MIRIAFSLLLSLLLFVSSLNASASAPTTATPDKISIVVEKAEISSDDLTYTPINYIQPGPVELNSGSNPEIGRQGDIPVGTYRGIHLTVTSISWHATWSHNNPSPCDGSESGETPAPGDPPNNVDLGGQTDFYFKTPDLGGNTLAYYLAHPPLSGYVGDATHPFVLASPIQVIPDNGGTTPTTVNLVIGVANTLTCDAVGFYDRQTDGSFTLARQLSGSASGSATQFNGLEGVYVDATNSEIGMINNGNNSVEFFNRTATGDVAPIRTLIGPNTRLNDPEGIALYQNPTDSTLNEIIVANQASNSLTTYSRKAAGNAGPLRTIVGMQTGLSRPAGVALYPDPGENPIKDEMVVANQGNDSLTVYYRLFSENTAPLRTLSGASTGLSSPAGLYVDTVNNEIGVANSGNNSVTIYNRQNVIDNTDPVTHIANVAPNYIISSDGGSDNTKLSIPGGVALYSDPSVATNDEIVVTNSGNNSVTIYNRQNVIANTDPVTHIANVAPVGIITGLNNPRALFLDSTNGEIGVVQQGPQVVMGFAPTIFLSSTNKTFSNSVDYNVVLYGVDIQGVNGHGIPVPVVFAERGKVTFDPSSSPWPGFDLVLYTQKRRQIIQPDCLEADINTNGYYGVNDDGSFYAFLPGIRGSIQGAFLPDGTAFVGSMVDSSSRLLVVYGLKSTGTTPYLTSDGTTQGDAATYAFLSYRNDLFSINRFNDPPTDDLLRYRLAIGGTHTNKTEFVDVNSDVNFVTVLNPMGDLAAPTSAGPIYNANADNSVRAQPYYPALGGSLYSLLYNLVGALSADGATLIFMRNTGTVDNINCPTNTTDIGFGTGLRQAAPGTFGPESLKGTYYMAGFGDQYHPSTQSSFHYSTAATLTFDGVGKVAIRFIRNEMGILTVSHAEFTYSVGAANVVNIFDRPSVGPFATANIGSQGRTLIFHQDLNPNGDANPTRLLGLALFQHP